MRRVIRSGMGLGDSLYLQSVARYFVGKGENVDVCSAWPDVFRPLAGKVTVHPFRRERINTLAHYTARKGTPGTSQFEDVCMCAGIREPVDLRIDWKPEHTEYPARLRARGRPVVCVQLPRTPMDRKDSFGDELLPDCERIQTIISILRDRATFVQVGKGAPLYQFTGLHCDLSNRTNVGELIDIAYGADAFLGYVSFIIPLAESLGKPGLFVWSRRGLKSRNAFINTVKPTKIIHRRDLCRYVIDDCSPADLEHAAYALLDQATSRAAA